MRSISGYYGRLARYARLALAILCALLVASCYSPEERAQHYYKDGEQLLARHENEKAEIQFKNAIQANHKFVAAWRGLAQAAELEHDWKTLIPALRTILELNPNDGTTRLQLGKLLLALGAADQALKVVDGASRPAADDPKLLALKSAILYKLKQTDAAIADAKAVLLRDPRDPTALMVLAADRLAANDPSGALQLVSRIPAQTDDLGVQLLKREIYEKLGDFAQVESILRYLTDRYPQNGAFRQQLVKFYAGQHRFADAESVLRSRVAADPADAKAELELVHLIDLAKGAEAARAELVDRIKGGRDVFTYQMALADFDSSHGDFAASVQLLESLGNSGGSPKHARAAKIKLAEMYLGKGNLDVAVNLISAVLQNDEHNVDALAVRAAIRLKRGEIDKAVSDLVEAQDADANSPKIMLMLALAYERGGSIELAEQQYADALRLTGFDPNIGLTFANFLQRRGETQRAENILTELAQRYPTNIMVLSALGNIKLADRDWAAAQAIGTKIEQIGNSGGIADQIIGTALLRQNKIAESIAYFRRAAAAAPRAIKPMTLLVEALVRAKRTDEAFSFLDSILKAEPGNAEVSVLLGSLEVANNEPGRAAKSFEQAIDDQPKDQSGYAALAALYLRQSDTDAALKTIQAGLKENPDNVVLHFGLANILEWTEDFEGAISQYEQVLAREPGSMVAANNLASLLADHRKDKASLARAQSLAARLRQSQVPQFMDTLAWVNYRRGDFEAAVPLLERAAGAMPNSALIHYHLAMGYLAVGRNKSALAEFHTALAKSPGGDLAKEIQAEISKMAKN